MRFSDKMVGVSQAIVTELKLRSKSAVDQVCLIENGVDEVLLSIRHEWCPSSVLRLLFIGSLIQRKGVDVLLRALTLMQTNGSLRLSIAGEGIEGSFLREMVRSYDLTEIVSFLGVVSPDNLPVLLKNHDVLVLPSYSEGRPNVILEAMAAGLPVIASAIPGVDELVIDGTTGLLFSAGDIAGLSRCISVLRCNPDLLENMGTNGRKMIMKRELLWQVTAEKYSKLYFSVQRGLT
jgi:glycosyltransferase involved in cell wall biosynthesis